MVKVSRSVKLRHKCYSEANEPMPLAMGFHQGVSFMTGCFALSSSIGIVIGSAKVSKAKLSGRSRISKELTMNPNPSSYPEPSGGYAVS